MTKAVITRSDVFRGVDYIIRSGGGSMWRPFPYTEEETLRDRGHNWGPSKRSISWVAK